MKLRKLGTDGPEVGAVGYGAMSFTNFYGPTSEEESLAVLDGCVDLGVSHIDTSDAYGMGHSESVIGAWLKARGGETPFTIASKVGITRSAEQRLNNSPEHMSAALDASLQRLGVEALDLYYLHRWDTRYPIEEVMERMAGFVKAGKIKAVGLSEIAPSTLRRAHAVHPVAAVQSEYSLSTRAPELGLSQTCAELGASLVAFSPVGRGLLTDHPHQAEKIATLPWLSSNPRFIEPNLSANLDYNAKFRALAADLGVAAASLAIAWVLRQGEHVMTIPGTRSVAHLQELVAGAELELSDETLAAIEAIMPVGWAHGDRYSAGQWAGPECYC